MVFIFKVSKTKKELLAKYNNSDLEIEVQEIDEPSYWDFCNYPPLHQTDKENHYIKSLDSNWNLNQRYYFQLVILSKDFPKISQKEIKRMINQYPFVKNNKLKELVLRLKKV